MSEDNIEEVSEVVDDFIPEPEPIPQIPCPSCHETGDLLTGWDEDGNEIYSDCYFCGGDGLLGN